MVSVHWYNSQARLRYVEAGIRSVMFDSSLFFCNIEIFKVGKKEIIPNKNIVHTACESSYQAFINIGTNVICLASCLKMIDTK